MKISIGDQYSKSFTVTEKMIFGFAQYTGDKNPVHIDEKFAQTTIFEKRIAHGFLVGSFVSSVLGNNFPGRGTIYLSQTMKFLKPVFIGDIVSVNIEVTDITDKNWLELNTECKNQDDDSVITGEAVVIPPSNCVLIK